MLLRSARSVLVQLWTQPPGILPHPAFQTPGVTRKRACAGGEGATGSGMPRTQEHRKKKGCVTLGLGHETNASLHCHGTFSGSPHNALHSLVIRLGVLSANQMHGIQVKLLTELVQTSSKVGANHFRRNWTHIAKEPKVLSTGAHEKWVITSYCTLKRAIRYLKYSFPHIWLAKGHWISSNTVLMLLSVLIEGFHAILQQFSKLWAIVTDMGMYHRIVVYKTCPYPT